MTPPIVIRSGSHRTLRYDIDLGLVFKAVAESLEGKKAHACDPEPAGQASRVVVRPLNPSETPCGTGLHHGPAAAPQGAVPRPIRAEGQFRKGDKETTRWLIWCPQALLTALTEPSCTPHASLWFPSTLNSVALRT